jgi:hypothetical protein
VKASEHPVLGQLRHPYLRHSLAQGDTEVCGQQPQAGAHSGPGKNAAPNPAGLAPCHLRPHTGPWHESYLALADDPMHTRWTWHGVRRLGQVVVDP